MAAKLRLDEEKGTVTILVPKVVPIDKLHSDSLQLAKQLSAGEPKEKMSLARNQSANRQKPIKSFRPTSNIDYDPFDVKKWEAKSISTNLYPWEGEQVVVLTTNNDLNPVVMKRFVQRLEAGWETYKELIGRSPNHFKHLDGKATIAAVPDAGLTCGYGCGYIGSTGVEVAGFYNSDYPLVQANPQAFSHYYFLRNGQEFLSVLGQTFSVHHWLCGVHAIRLHGCTQMRC